ncbi:hypothetical protein [Paramagnetospirillum magneticum]|uniref:Transmembrane protein n=1 Tax=Paramagnetospirillum magneticum (strain ATCC 700264 / AMB-1) TaxID=342108 RepID=Q2W7M3_PARM1|nr:hypothetical protein amb1348 [Paramagnetospirillum magneticum AMB-1]
MPVSEPSRRHPLVSALLVPPAVILLLLEEVIWAGLKALMARLGRLPLVARLEARIQALPPLGAAALFLAPGAVMFPFKLMALWAITQGHVLWGLLVLLTAKLTATALFARIYTLCKPTLMTVAWFVRLHDWINGVKAWAHARLNGWRLWRFARRATGRLRAWVTRAIA